MPGVVVVAVVVAVLVTAGLASSGGSPSGSAAPEAAVAVAPEQAALGWVQAWAGTDGVLADAGFAAGLRGSPHRPAGVTTPAQCPTDRCRAGWVVLTPALRSQLPGDAAVAAAVTASTPVAEFGAGPDAIVIRQAGTEPAEVHAGEQRARAAVGRALSTLPGLVPDPGARTLFDTGRVDPRVLAVLAVLAQSPGLRVLELPAQPGEDAAGSPRRAVVLSPPAAGTDELRGYFAVQNAPYRPASLTPVPAGLLVTYPPPAPSHLLDAFAGP